MFKNLFNNSVNKFDKVCNNFDKLTPAMLFILLAIVVLLGIYMSFSATLIISGPKFLSKHILFAIIGAFLFLICGFVIDYKTYQKLKYPIFLLITILLVVSLFFGHSAKGAVRWIPLPLGFRFQPSELVKISLIIIMSDFLARKSKFINQNKTLLAPLLYIIIPCLLIGKQDLGTVILISMTWLIMLFVSGLSWKKTLYTFAALLVGYGVYIIMKPHRIKRVLDYIHSVFDIYSAHPNVKAALVAFGSGGFLGKGPGASEMKLKHLPEFHTDFIFPILGEEFGFIGTLFTISLFLSIFFCGLLISKNCKDDFGKNLAFGITIIFFLQVMINMGMTTGIIPTKGMTLPFISYGGTSMLTSMIMMGILFNIAKAGKR